MASAAIPTAAGNQRGRAQYVRLAQVIGVLFVGYLIIGIPLPVLPLRVHHDLGFGPFMVGVVAGAQFAASLCSRMFAGRFTDTRGPKSAFVVGLLLTAASGMLYLASLPFGATASVSLLIAGRVILGFGESFIVTGALGWGLMVMGSGAAGKAMSWLGTSLYAAFAIGAPIGTSLYGRFGFSAVAIATVVIPLLTLALVAPMGGVTPPPPAPAGLKKVFGVVWLPGTALALSGVGFSAIMTFAALLYSLRHWSPAWLAFTALSVAFIFGRGVLGHLPDKVGGVRIALACIVVEAIGQALIWFAPNATIALLGIIVTGLGYSLVYPGLGTSVVNAAPPQSRALALGAYTAFLDVSLGFSGPLLGLVATGRDLINVYAVSTFVVLGSAAIALWMLRRHSISIRRKSHMRATIMPKALDVRIDNIPDAAIKNPTDAVIRVTRACICGSDLWPYNGGPNVQGQRMGHEAIGVVEDIGSDVQTIKRGDVVIMPFVNSDGTCLFCEEGLPAACVHRGFFGNGGDLDGAQAEALRIPMADGTLYPLQVAEDDALMPSLLTLSDVLGTGHHAAVTSRVRRGGIVAVVGDGAVGLCGVIASKRLGAEQIIVLGRHEKRIALAREFGATDVVSERGEEAIDRVRQLTGGHGVQSVLECVGTEQAMDTSMGIVRPGGAVGRVGVPHYEAIKGAQQMFYNNVIVAGGPAPTRAYIDELLPDVMEGRIDPGRVFDRTVGLDGVPDGYRAMNDRETLKVLIRP